MDLVTLDALGRLGQPVPWYRAGLRRRLGAIASRKTGLAPPPTSTQLDMACAAYEHLVAQLEPGGDLIAIVKVLGPPATRKQIKAAVRAEAFKSGRPVTVGRHGIEHTKRRVTIWSYRSAIPGNISAEWCHEADPPWRIVADIGTRLSPGGLDAIVGPPGFELEPPAPGFIGRLEYTFQGRRWSLTRPEW